MLHNAGKSQKARWEFTDIQVDRDMFELVRPVAVERVKVATNLVYLDVQLPEGAKTCG